MQKQHLHPVSGAPAFGVLLVPGTILHEDDIYPSPSGEWKRCPFPGARFAESWWERIWIRLTKFRQDEESLLRQLAMNSSSCISRSDESCSLIFIWPPLSTSEPGGLRMPVRPEAARNLIDLKCIGLVSADKSAEYFKLTKYGQDTAQALMSIR